MNTYQGLRNICSIWLLLSLIVGILIGMAGAVRLVNGDLIGILIIAAALALVLFAQTLSEVISLLIDMTLYLRRISEANEPETKPIRAPQLGVRKIPKE